MVAVVCAARVVRGMEEKKIAGLDVAPARRGVARVDADSPEGSETRTGHGETSPLVAHAAAARRYIPRAR
jgi:hypothetical protein